MDSSNEQLDRLNLLYEKLKSSQVPVNYMKPHEQTGAKQKMRNVQSLIMKFYSEIEQSNQDRDNRIEIMTDRLYKLQASLQDDMSKRDIKGIYILISREGYRCKIDQGPEELQESSRGCH
jgi:hypothetical protein